MNSNDANGFCDEVGVRKFVRRLSTFVPLSDKSKSDWYSSVIWMQNAFIVALLNSSASDSSILFPFGISRGCVVVACRTCLDFPAIWICSLALFNSTALFPDKFDLCRDSAICQLISTFHALHVSFLISLFLGTFLDANGSGKSEQFIFTMVVQHLPTLSNEMWKCVWSSSILGSLKGRGKVWWLDCLSCGVVELCMVALPVLVLCLTIWSVCNGCMAVTLYLSVDLPLKYSSGLSVRFAVCHNLFSPLFPLHNLSYPSFSSSGRLIIFLLLFANPFVCLYTPSTHRCLPYISFFIILILLFLPMFCVSKR